MTNKFDLTHYANYTFDTKVALSGLYLWLLFGFLSNMVSCDFQKMMKNNLVLRHIVGIVSFFLLFTVLDTTNKVPVPILMIKTLFIYFLFLLMMKNKYYTSIPILGLIVFDQVIKVHINYLMNINSPKEEITTWEKHRDTLNFGLIGLIIAGFLSYAYRQYNEFGDDFSWTKLLFDYRCNDN